MSMIAFVSLMALFFGGALALKSAPALGGLLIAIAAVGFFATILVSTALQQVFRVVLYRFAMGQPLLPGFSREELANAARERRRSPLGRLLRHS